MEVRLMKEKKWSNKNVRHDGDSGTPQSLINSNRFTHFKKAATQIIRGAAKARFRRTLRAGFADAHTAPYRKFGFTLAEVLITLGVIGIVAAMTIPNLVQSYQEKVTVTKVKKFYSTMWQAYLFAVQEYGSPSEWGISNMDKPNNDEENDESYTPLIGTLIRDRLLKNVKTIKVCDNSRDLKACGFANKYYRNGNEDIGVGGNKLSTGAAAILADGSSVAFVSSPSDRGSGALKHIYANIYYDVNGINPPNTYGEDYFMFYFTNENIMPVGTQGEILYSFANNCLDANGKNSGISCSVWVIQNGNMDYLHCDDLSRDGKHKCSD